MALVFTLAGGKAPSQSEEEWILWGLPLSRALHYYHCALRRSGAWTVPVEDAGAKLAEAERALAAIRDAAVEVEDDAEPW